MWSIVKFLNANNVPHPPHSPSCLPNSWCLCVVVGEASLIRALGNVGAVYRLEVVEQVEVDLADAKLHKLGRLLRYVDAHPLTV